MHTNGQTASGCQSCECVSFVFNPDPPAAPVYSGGLCTCGHRHVRERYSGRTYREWIDDACRFCECVVFAAASPA